MSNLLSSIITSKTRNHLFLRLFLNTETRAYLREIALELGSSTNAVREELNRLVEAKLLINETKGKKVLYGANKRHPLFPELQSMVRKVLGIEHLMDSAWGILNQRFCLMTTPAEKIPASSIWSWWGKLIKIASMSLLKTPNSS